jgi:hypothetical protein
LTFRAKQRVTFAFLVALAMWPFVHRALVWALEIDPWSFGGFAMYCTPRLDVRVGAEAYRQGLPLDAPVPQSVAPAAMAFGERRMVLGALATPDELAEAVLSAMPAADGVAVLFERRTLDPGTATIRAERDEVRYRRSAENVERVP